MSESGLEPAPCRRCGVTPDDTESLDHVVADECVDGHDWPITGRVRSQVEDELPNPSYVHIAVLRDELWSPACGQTGGWTVPLAHGAFIEQVTCPACLERAAAERDGLGLSAPASTPSSTREQGS